MHARRTSGGTAVERRYIKSWGLIGSTSIVGPLRGGTAGAGVFERRYNRSYGIERRQSNSWDTKNQLRYI